MVIPGTWSFQRGKVQGHKLHSVMQLGTSQPEWSKETALLPHAVAGTGSCRRCLLISPLFPGCAGKKKGRKEGRRAFTALHRSRTCNALRVGKGFCGNKGQTVIFLKEVWSHIRIMRIYENLKKHWWTSLTVSAKAFPVRLLN